MPPSSRLMILPLFFLQHVFYKPLLPEITFFSLAHYVSPSSVSPSQSRSLTNQETDKYHSDLVMCRKQPGIAIGRLCDKCDGKCPVCDSYVRPTTLVRICDECSFGNYQNKCVVCGGEVSYTQPPTNEYTPVLILGTT